eukprot:TRINITY_DN852_c0_g3_i1.p1 TRINITY_DN852_c0_g3~~TRINITY_DN852_c0_g3_i1.p1  ORF type:complete len:499 (+),score=82.86 TRINITY_DN852_c0_g3_i1:47-1498(+)
MCIRDSLSSYVQYCVSHMHLLKSRMKSILITSFLPFCLCGEFIFGIATSAMQIEGAWLENNRTMTIWDNLAHSGFVKDNTNADVAADSYHRFDRDIALMKEYGIKHYRMSIPWTRIMPRGVAGSPVNYREVMYYRNLLKILKDQRITAYVNLFHNDIPAILAINGTGKYDVEFPDHFAYYADVCFREFGDLVPFWFTFDEPWCQSIYEHTMAFEANVKPYRIAHHLLLAHARAVKTYREKYAERHRGKIGINLIGEMAWPFDPNSKEDVEAAERSLIFQVDWFADPIFKGDYPPLMKTMLGERLPKFTEAEKTMVKGSIDFFAINHYHSFLAKQGGRRNKVTYFDDVNVTHRRKAEWKSTDMGWPIVPEGMHDLLVYVYKKWVKEHPMEIWVTENGIAVHEPTTNESLHDTLRIDYMSGYISELAKARSEGVPVERYFAWSLLDNFEWGSGLGKRFGLTRVDYETLKRIPKLSMRWYAQLLKD